MEFYVGKRRLIELSTKVPARIHGFLEDIGVAHYFVVVKQTSDGSLTQYDFGPVGGRDIAFGNCSELPTADILGSVWRRREARRFQQAEIREMKV